jgi:hypothetical protein
MLANKFLRDMAGVRIDVVLSERQVDVDGSTMGEVRHRRHQTYGAVRIPNVCRSCNNEWISHRERCHSPGRANDPRRPTGISVRTRR